MMTRFFIRYKHTLTYGSAMAVLLLLLQWLEWRFVILDHALVIYSGALALLFTGLGIWLALRLAKPKISTVIVEKEVYITPQPVLSTPQSVLIDERVLNQLGLSIRELEVLQLMAEGLSNQEIAGRLFVSLNTIKTHAARIFEKLDVQRRTQAVDKARKLRIIA